MELREGSIKQLSAARVERASQERSLFQTFAHFCAAADTLRAAPINVSLNGVIDPSTRSTKAPKLRLAVKQCLRPSVQGMGSGLDNVEWFRGALTEHK